MNVDIELQNLIDSLKNEGRTPSLLLHACCAPCAVACLERVVEHFDVTLFYYNPNITERDEYEKRLKELKRVSHAYGVNVIDGKYCENAFFEYVKGYEQEPERGKRCELCFRLRLEKTQETANNKFDYFATTLTLSPLKNANLINEIGLSITANNTKYLPTDFKKRGGNLKSKELSQKYNLYRQNYCGCVFSKRD